jgi:ATP-dependent Clp protease ATP-binding subunit ClpC
LVTVGKKKKHHKTLKGRTKEAEKKFSKAVQVTNETQKDLIFDYNNKVITWNFKVKEYKDKLEKGSGTESSLFKNEQFKNLLDDFNNEYKDSLIILPPYDGNFRGREKELSAINDTIANILEPTRIILGNAGTGKTTIVREATRRINSGKMTNKMGYNLVCVELSLLALLDEGDSKFTATLSEMIPKILELEKKAREFLEDENIKFVLFIDEVHTLTKAVQKENGESNGADVLKRHIKPEIGSLILIGATTLEEYRYYIETNQPFKERFSEVTILQDFSKEEVEEIAVAHWEYLTRLRGITNSSLSRELIRFIIRVNAREDLMSAEPRKTKQFLQSLDAHSFNVGKTPDYQMVIDVFRSAKNITAEVVPDIKSATEAIDRRIKGQYASKYLLKRALVARYGNLSKSDNSPFLSLLELGPTGVGKTETAKVLNEYIFGGLGKIVLLNCSNYAYIEGGVEKFLKEAGEQVGDSEFAILVIDEVEKAIPSKENKIISSLRDVFLDLTGEGILKYAPRFGGVDRKTSLAKAIVIFTSNAGYEIFEGNDKFSDNTITRNTPENEIRRIMFSVVNELESHLHEKYNFAREFFGRLDATLPFTSLTEADAIELTELFLSQYIKEAKEQENIEILIDDKIEYESTLIRGLDDGETRKFYPLAVTLSSYIANMRDSSKGGARQVQKVFNNYLNVLIGDLKLKRDKFKEAKTIQIYPRLLEPDTGKIVEDKEEQKQARLALKPNRMEDIEIFYEEI